LAADESTGTIQRRFDAIGVENTEANRRAYRELLFRTTGVANYISGVILYDETIRQSSSDGTPFVDLLRDQGIVPGLKVDLGAKPLPFAPEEQITEGLDGLRERLIEYRSLGARFTKWRAVLSIGERRPSWYSIEANANALARFAALSQEAEMVPMVEPEVLMDGPHSIERSYETTVNTLREVFRQLAISRVRLEGTLLKTNMVMSGLSASKRSSADEVARATVECLRESVPAAVPGILFLSGGQSDAEATRNLDAISRYAATVGVPWELSFSYGRGLQAAPQRVWSGKPENVTAAQQAYRHRAKLTAAARSGKYEASMEREAPAAD
jgi:fructose-bisphosphate aldolase, class I